MNIDWERINELIDPDDSEDVIWLKNYMGDLIVAFEGYLSDLSIALNANDKENSTSLLHQIKGVSANNGFETLRSIATEAEILSRSNKLESVKKLVVDVPSIWQETKAELVQKLEL